MGKIIQSPILIREILVNPFYKKTQLIYRSLAYNPYLKLQGLTSLEPKSVKSIGRQ